MPYDASEWDIFHTKNNQLIILFIIYLINIIIFNFSVYKCLMEKKVVPKLQQEVKVDIVTSDDIKIYYTGKFQDFTARYIINSINQFQTTNFRLLQTKEFAEDNFKLNENGKKVLQKGRKYCGKKGILLVMSNFSFSHSVFKRLVLQTRKKTQACLGKG